MTIDVPPSPNRGRGRRRAAGRLALGSGLSFLFVATTFVPAVAEPQPGSGAAPAAPGSPRAAADPTELFVEDFENDPTPAATLITDYVGADGTTYSADGVWADAARCNGLVVDHSSTNAVCGAMRQVRALASALGTIAGADDPQTNHVISAYTNGGDTGAGLVQLETVRPIPVEIANRYVTFSVDTVAMNCSAPDDPQLAFSLFDGEVETPVADRPVDPCLDDGLTDFVVDGFPMRGGRIVSPGAVLFSGTEMGVRLRNLQGGGAGNDAAFDTVRVLDVTPRAAVTLPATAVAGDVVDLVVDVTNTSEKGAKPGWSFAQALPTGLRVAETREASSTCSAATVVATGGSDTFSVRADLDENDTACQVTVPVLVDAAGTHVVASSRSTLSGLLPASDRIIAVDTEAASISTSLSARLDDVADGGTIGVADAGDRLTWVQTVVNVGNAPVRNVTSTRRGMTCEATDLAVGGRTSCTSPTYTIDQAAVDGGDISAVVRAEAISRLGAPLSTTEARVTVPVTNTAVVTIVGGPVLDDVDADGLAGVGESIRASYVVTNVGSVTLRDISLVVDGRRVGDARCPATTLAPGRDVTCATDDLAVTEDDLLAGPFDFAARATSVGPSGSTVESTTVDDVVPVVAARAALALGSQVAIADGDGGSIGVADVGDAVTLAYQVRNEGTLTVSGLAVSTTISDGTRLETTCLVDTLAPRAATECVAPGRTTTQADVDAGRIAFDGTASAIAVTGPVSAGPSTDVVPVTDPRGTIGIASEVTARDADGADRTGEPARPGDVVTARYTVANVGTVTLADVAMRVVDGLPQVRSADAVDPPIAEIDVDCDGDRLAPGASLACVATRTVVETDLGSPSLWLTGTVTGVRPDGTLVHALRSSDPIGLVKPAPALSTSTVVTRAGHKVGELGLGDVWQGRVRVVNTGNVELSGLRALGFTCDVDRLTLGRATHCTSLPGTVGARDVDAGRVSVTATARAADRWGTRVESTSSAQVVVGRGAVAPVAGTPVERVLAFTGSPLAVTVLAMGLAMAVAGTWLIVAGRRRPRTE